MSKITVFSLYDSNYASVGDLISQNHKQYCYLHGYNYVCKKDNFNFPDVHPAWQKVFEIKKYLIDNEDVDYILWIDADAFFYNIKIKIEDILVEKSINSCNDPFMYISIDPIMMEKDNGINNACSGIFLLKNCKECISFLEYWCSFQKQFPNCGWENSAYCHIVNNNKYDISKFCFLQQKVLNGVWMQYEQNPNTFIIHMCGSQNHQRVGTFNCLNPFNLNKNDFHKYLNENGFMNFYNQNKFYNQHY